MTNIVHEPATIEANHYEAMELHNITNYVLKILNNTRSLKNIGATSHLNNTILFDFFYLLVPFVRQVSNSRRSKDNFRFSWTKKKWREINRNCNWVCDGRFNNGKQTDRLHIRYVMEFAVYWFHSKTKQKTNERTNPEKTWLAKTSTNPYIEYKTREKKYMPKCQIAHIERPMRSIGIANYHIFVSFRMQHARSKSNVECENENKTPKTDGGQCLHWNNRKYLLSSRKTWTMSQLDQQNDLNFKFIEWIGRYFVSYKWYYMIERME